MDGTEWDDFRTSKHFTHFLPRTIPYLIKLVIPHNVTSTNGEFGSFRSMGVHPSNTHLTVRLVTECDGVHYIIARWKLPIFIQKYFFPSTVIEVDVSKKEVKLVWRRKPVNEEGTSGAG